MQMHKTLPAGLYKNYIKFVYELYKAGETGWAKKPTKQDIDIFLKSASSHYFITHSGKIVAHAGYHKIYGNEKNAIIFIAVNKEYRRKGIGKRLVNFILKEGKRGGLSRMIAFVKKQNKAGKMFFSSCNFQKLYDMELANVYAIDL
ncbi:MAG: GNAT family N-acetyltransferase [Candidatus Anstonellales archaeon]